MPVGPCARLWDGGQRWLVRAAEILLCNQIYVAGPN